MSISYIRKKCDSIVQKCSGALGGIIELAVRGCLSVETTQSVLKDIRYIRRSKVNQKPDHHSLIKRSLLLHVSTVKCYFR